MWNLHEIVWQNPTRQFPGLQGCVEASCSRLDVHPKGTALNFKALVQLSLKLFDVANQLQTQEMLSAAIHCKSSPQHPFCFLLLLDNPVLIHPNLKKLIWKTSVGVPPSLMLLYTVRMHHEGQKTLVMLSRHNNGSILWLITSYSPVMIDQSPDGHLSTWAFVGSTLETGHVLLLSGYQASARLCATVCHSLLALTGKLKYMTAKWMLGLWFVWMRLGFIFP